MARARVAVALVLLALCGLASAGRVLPDSVEGFVMRALTLGSKPHTDNRGPLAATQLASDLEAMLDVEGGHDGWPVHVVAEIFSPPSVHPELIEEYLRLEEEVYHSGAKVNLHLSKPIGDNIKFVSYLYAENVGELRKMMECHAFRDFARFLYDRNIAVAHQRLIKIGASGWKSHKATAAAADQVDADARLDAAMAGVVAEEQLEVDLSTCTAEMDEVEQKTQEPAGNREHRVFRMVGLYNVPPGHGRKFASAWKKLACKASRWPSHIGMSLFKVAGDNTGFVSYAAWEARGRPSKKEREEKWAVFRKYREDIDDLGVTVRAKPLIAIRAKW